VLYNTSVIYNGLRLTSVSATAVMETETTVGL